MNRRAKFTAIAIALITIAFYICVFKGAELEWFEVYSERIIFALLFVVAGITTTDGLRTWRNGGADTTKTTSTYSTSTTNTDKQGGAK